MKQSHFHLKTWLTMSALTGFLCLGAPVNAQSASAQNTPALQGDDATRQELANFNRFLRQPSRNRGAGSEKSLVRE